MATLEKIRNKATLLVVIVGLALFSFIIGDFLRSGSTFFNQRKENIAVVNGQTIKIQEYQRKVEERTNMLKARNNGMSINEDQTNQIRFSVLNEWINKILLEEECDKLGLAISKDELQDLIMGDNISPMIQQMPDFQDPKTHQFNRNNLLQFLQTIESDDYSNYSPEIIGRLIEAKQNWLNIEQQVHEQQLQSKLMALLSATLVVNNLDAKATYEDSKLSVDFDYISQFYASIPDDAVTVSDSEIAKLYNERKTTFKQAESVLLDYIMVNIVPAQQDKDRVLARMEAIKTRIEESGNPSNVIAEVSEIPYVDAYVSYNQLSKELKSFVDHAATGEMEGPVLNNFTYNIYKLEGETTAPDSVKLNIISLPQTTDEKIINHIGDSLIGVLKNGVSFADMASSVTGGNSDGSIGWQTETSLVKQIDASFKNEVFAAKINEPVIIRAGLGHFLVQVVEKTAPVKKYKIATVQLTVSPSQETKTKLYNDLNQYISSNHNLESFKKSAAESGYNIQANVEVAKDQFNLSGVENTRQIIQWAFKNKKGAISDIYECQGQEYFVVAAVEGILPEGFRPLASVSEMLKRELLNDKKGEKIIADLKAKNLSDMTQYAEAMNNTNPQSIKFVTFSTPRISGIGVEPILNVEAPKANVGAVSGPYKGKNAVYVIQVTDKKESEQVYNEATQIQTMEMQNAYRLIYRMFQANNSILKENAKVENNYSRFY